MFLAQAAFAAVLFEYTGTTTDSYQFGSNYHLAQSFTTGSNASSISNVEVALRYGQADPQSSGDVKVSLYDVDGNGEPSSLLESKTINTSTLTITYPTETWNTFTFDSPIPISENTQYAMVIGCSNCSMGSGAPFVTMGVNDYSGGAFYLSMDSGGSWTEMTFAPVGEINERTIKMRINGSESAAQVPEFSTYVLLLTIIIGFSILIRKNPAVATNPVHK